MTRTLALALIAFALLWSEPVRAHTGNGSINLGAVSGSVWGRTGNGDIQVSLVSVADDAELHLRTGNGRVQLDLPTDLDAELVARLAHGMLISDFPLTISGRVDFRNLEAVIGGGGARLTVVSGSGDLVLRGRGAPR